jgi:phosphoglycerate dehydrogenase-like enzyme
MDNVICTPHTASTAYENSRRSVAHWLANILHVHRGEDVPEKDRVL